MLLVHCTHPAWGQTQLLYLALILWIPYFLPCFPFLFDFSFSSVLWDLVFRASQVEGDSSGVQLDSLVSSGSENPGCLSDAEETRFGSVISVSLLALPVTGFQTTDSCPLVCDSALSIKCCVRIRGQGHPHRAVWGLQGGWSCLKTALQEQNPGWPRGLSSHRVHLCSTGKRCRTNLG